MSCIKVGDDSADVCANCGKTGSGTVQLKNCTACRLVKYCGVDCQKVHRKHHKKACKQRAAELKDEQLYSQGHERPEGDFCPICTLPIPLPMQEHSVFTFCCVKRVCMGCFMTARQRGIGNICAFCRTPMPKDGATCIAMIQKRIEAGDAEAMLFLGSQYYFGGCGLKKDVQKAIEFWTKASELRSIGAHYELGHSYYNGDGVEKDEAIAVGHWQHAAVKGHVESRHQLGVVKCNERNYHLAMKHFLISANMGDKLSLDQIKEMFMRGYATKTQYAEALEGYQAAVEETKSHQREKAKGLEAAMRDRQLNTK